MTLNKFDYAHKDVYLLLGPQEVGKTCFLTGLYYTFRSTLNGFGLSCVNEEQRAELDGICKRLESGEFPTGTSTSSKYQFKLRFAHTERFGFEWYDYRGGLLKEYGLKNSEEYEELTRVIQNTTCIILCIDGTWLSKNKNESVKRIQDESYVINEFIHSYVDSNKKLAPICIVITKYDECEKGYEAVYYEAIRESFAFFENRQTPIFICPVCIGKKDVNTDKFRFDPTDQDIYRPLFYALWCGYHYRICGMEKKLTEDEKRVQIVLQNLQDKIKEIEGKVVVFNRQKRMNELKNDIDIISANINHVKQEIASLKQEQSELLRCLCSAENIYFGDKKTTWEEVSEKWKFFQ